MVDYSKWDSYAADISDSDDDDHMPSVTKLEDSSKVQIGPQGVTVISAHDNSTVTSSQKKSGTDDGSGGKTNAFSWTQNRDEVFIKSPLPVGVRSSNIKCSYDDGDIHVYISGLEIFGGKLKHPIERESDDIDWEIIDDSKSSNITERVLAITLRKKSIIPGAVIWWSCIFVGDPEIDVEAIKGRKKVDLSSWNEAHKMFKEKIAQRELINIDSTDETAKSL